jgi:hypothetical protein
MQNHRTPAELKTALDAIVAELKAIDVRTIPDAELVPLVRTTADVCAFSSLVEAHITRRVISDGADVPGAARKPGITHRKWNDTATASTLAFEAYGLRAFKLESPAAIEKLGENGVALVAIASTKPPATDRVVY